MAEQIKMSDTEVDHWWKCISNRKKFMEPYHSEWRSNLDRYQLKNINIPGLAEDETVLISRIYPMVRKIIASIAFNYPEVFVRIEDTKDVGSEGLEDILNVAANDILDVMNVQRKASRLYHSLGYHRGDGHTHKEADERQSLSPRTNRD